VGLRESFGELQQHSTKAQPLKVVPYCDSPKPSHRFGNIYSDNANHDTFMKKNQRVIAGFAIVGMVFDVDFRLAAILKEHLAANGMKSKPLIVSHWCSQFVFDHLG
jgi:hypothetical protein